MLILKLFPKCLAQLPSTLMRFGLVLVLALAIMPSVGAVENRIDIEAFVRNGCPHCQQAEQFLAVLQGEQPGLRIVIRNISAEPTALERLQQITESRQAGPIRLPTFLVHGEYIVGYSEEAGSSGLIRNALRAGALPSEVSGAEAGSCEVQVSESCDVPVSQPPAPATEVFAVNWFGRRIGLDEVGLPAFTLAMGLLDGFNPCSMWVLILMISMLAPMNNRPRMLAVAGTFVVVEGMAYFVFMAAWLNLFLLIGLSRASELAIAGIAVLAGAINLKDFWAFGRGISLSIPVAAKPGIYNRIRRILQAENLAGAMLGAVVLALLVQIVELLCTSGFPALYTRILTLRELSGWDYYGYLMLYNLAYMLDDVVVLGVGVVTLSQHRLQEKEGRWLKLLSGLAMVSLGLYLILRGLGE
ncbi:NrdH-redoxin [Methylomonas sp. LW13]|uniref:Glutaredoxin domain-containing protein n=1 Tax=Methylomonas defluvii TaxID=3045149 RepID=A0ABU4UKB1_9GAMM|nr:MULTISPECIES: glutaredoxin domain-containing protein [unclassified Methylomonas]MDX8129297.1 glutaredoxin domain-containing protein [Methylomonas sp. OY6]PKD41878.1 NrdH-redoxin [Methylomonas sp. Kb3]QBC26726.1 NrdH-redoxin [Methylomonas sp. LW13]